jgi:hypothetical protein
LSEKFKKEYELRDHIAENFSQFFDFTFVGKEFHIGKKRVDLAGEDDKTFYLIELKRARVYRSAINQMEKYISLYKTQSTKAVRGILVAPKISNNEEAYIDVREDLGFLKIEDPFIRRMNHCVDCGKEISPRGHTGKCLTCHCRFMNLQRYGDTTERIGMRHGRLTVLSMVKIEGRTLFQFRCDCGTEKVLAWGSLKRTWSCGCLNSEVARQRMTTHGMRRSPEYRIWSNMINRCTDKQYKNYAGRGITVCERWLKFADFFADMGTRPSRKHSIDRIKNDEGYSRENCQWVLPAVQANNTRRNRLIAHGGKTQSLMLWAREIGINYFTLKNRLKLGWSFDEAITRRCHFRHSGLKHKLRGFK